MLCLLRVVSKAVCVLDLICCSSCVLLVWRSCGRGENASGGDGGGGSCCGMVGNVAVAVALVVVVLVVVVVVVAAVLRAMMVVKGTVVTAMIFCPC